MGVPLLTQLLQEAGDRTTELAARAEEVSNAAHTAAGHATTLGNLALHEADQLHQQMADAVDAMKIAQEQADRVAGAADQALHALASHAQQAEAHLKELLAAVHDDAVHLGEARQRLLAGAHASTAQTDAAFQELSTHIQDLQHRMDARLQEAEAHLQTLQQAVTDSSAHVDAEGQKLHGTMRDTHAAANQKTWDVVAAMDLALSTIGEHVVTLVNDAIHGHNVVTATIRHGYLSESAGSRQPSDTWLSTAFHPLHDQISDLLQLPEHIRDTVHQPVATILENGEKALTALTEVGDSVRRAMPQER